MKPIIWKILAITFMILFICENTLIIWDGILSNKDNSRTNECWYDVCAEYPNAYYDTSNYVCFCYDYDVLGNEQVVKTKIIK